MGNYVTARVGNYVTLNPPHLGNFVIAHTVDVVQRNSLLTVC